MKLTSRKGARLILRGSRRALFKTSFAFAAVARRSVVLLAIMLYSGGCSVPRHDSILGRWEGVAEYQGAKIPLSFDFLASMNGLRVRASAPDLHMLGAELSNVRFAPPSVHFEIEDRPRRMVFEGLHSGDAISGSLHYGDVQATFNLQRRGEVPQSPYREEEVSFRANDVSLTGRLLIPQTKGPHACVVLVHDAGRQSYDRWQHIGDLFARHGIAALIYNKRDVSDRRNGQELVDLSDLDGDALASVQSLSLQDLAGDVLSALRFLKGHDGIDGSRIGLWGIGQGGLVATVAAAQSKEVAFLITVSAPGVSGAELHSSVETVARRASDLSGQSHETSSSASRQPAGGVAGADNRDSASPQRAARQGNSSAAILPLTEQGPSFSTILRSRDSSINPSDVWGQIRIPVLAIYGGRDEIVPVAPSSERIAAALKRAGNNDVTFRTWAEADHEIKLPAGVRADTGGTWDFPRMIQDYQETMVDWALRRVEK